MAKPDDSNKDSMFYGQGNDTVSLPSQLKGKSVLVDVHATPGVKEKGMSETVILKGWNQ